MSIVESANSPREPVLPPGMARVVGLLLAVAVAFAQILVLMNLGHDLDVHLAAQAAARGARLWWSDSPGWLVVPVIVTIIAPLTVLPGAFGWRARQLMPPTVRWRWRVVLAMAAVCLLIDGAMLIFGRTGGYATAREAVWTSNGAVAVRHPWREAKSVGLSCFMLGKKGQQRTPRLAYDVRFEGGRTAKIGLVVRPGQSLAAWMAAVSPIAAQLAALPPAAINRGTFDPACMAATAMAADQAGLARVLAIRPGG
ncbi:MAG: hypothetical protein JWP35_4726 [Caulobacter sp.]|nr:hypothetical protein [Caulobacter sp.]